jgi:sulfur-oxidizing protein SoxY
MTPVSELGRLVTNAVRRRYILLAACALLLLCQVAAAQSAQQSADARWPQIKEALLGGDRVVRDGADVIVLSTPARALDAAVVPVDIATRFEQTPERHISKLYLIIDNNPSPVAAVFEFPGDRDWKTISTRVRINAYTDVRVVAELNDGETYMTTNYVKASGGCSAPALKDPAAAAAQLGRMKLIMPEDDTADDLLLARLMVRHPNTSGLQFDQITRHFIPADYVRTIEVSYQEAPLFKVATDISISENPTIAFGFAPDSGAGMLDVQVIDSEGRRFEQQFPLAPVH